MKKCFCGRKVKVVENYIDGKFYIKLYCENCGNVSQVYITKEENAVEFCQEIINEWNRGVLK